MSGPCSCQTRCVFIARCTKQNDIYKDIARVSEPHRRDAEGAVIPEGSICKISAGGKSILLSLRGDQENNNPTICLDEITRAVLKVKPNDQADFTFRQVRWLGQFLWAWKASDPAYRIAARLGLLSLILGLIGLVLGGIGLYITLCSS
jgi:hypothetical protein